MSEHKNLHEALCAFQAEVETLPKDATNPHFKSKFTPLDTIVEKVAPLLSKHGLTWSTFPCFGPDNQPALRYKLTHATSGDSESETMPLMVTKADPQGLGSSLTYARRYSLSAVLNLVSDDDDDGNAASPRQAAAPKLATAKDVKEITEAAKGMSAEQIKLALAACGIPNVDYYEDVPAAKVAPLVKALVGAQQ
jgi:hypothetical protein